MSFANEGPEEVGQVVGFAVQSLDSVYVTSKGRKTLFLMNRQGLLCHKYDYSGTSRGSMAGYSTTKTPVILTDTALYLPRMPEGNWSILPEEQMNSFNLCLGIRQDNDTTFLLPITYPESSYKTKSVQYQWCYDGGSVIFSFERSENVYITENFVKWKAVDGKSRFYEDIKPPPLNPSPGDYLRYSCETPSYTAIIFDKYRNVYYRFCYQGIETSKNDNLMQLASFKPRFSILIMDKDFRVTGETLLPDNQFYMEEFFVAKDGLYISENNVFNESYNEYFLTYRLLKLETR